VELDSVSSVDLETGEAKLANKGENIYGTKFNVMLFFDG
jgi:hypothetical protein